MTVTLELAKFLAEKVKFDKLPEKTIESAKEKILDWLGVALAGNLMGAAKTVTNMVKAMGGVNEATLLGHREKVPALNAAFANGFCTHILELDDGDSTNHMHVSCNIMPAALAAAEIMGASGKDLITAVIAGYEAGIRIGNSLLPEHYDDLGFHITGTAGIFGAAVAAGKIFNLDTEQMASALGLAGTQSSALVIAFQSDGKPLHAAKAAMDGLLSSLLVKNGITGPVEVLDGKTVRGVGFGPAYTGGKSNPEMILHYPNNLGENWRINYIYHRTVPCTFQNIGLLIDVIVKNDIKPDDVEEVICKFKPSWMKAHGWNSDGSSVGAAKASFPHIVATTMYYRDLILKLEQFNKIYTTNKQVLEFMKKVKMVEVPDAEHLKLKWYVTIKTRDGREYGYGFSDIIREKWKGDWGNPLTREELHQKFRWLASRELSKEKVEKIIELVEELEEVADIRQLTDLLAP